MSRDYPDWIQPERAAQARRQIIGSMPVKAMTRVVDLLDMPHAEEDGTDGVDIEPMNFDVQFWRDEQRNVRVDCELNGQVPMLCQRSLKRYWQPIRSASSLVVIESESALSSISEDLEPKVCPDGKLKLMELIEDELILALPIVPLDPNTEPVEATEDFEQQPPEQNEDNPFAALAELRKR